jgi:hypothetical protein
MCTLFLRSAFKDFIKETLMFLGSKLPGKALWHRFVSFKCKSYRPEDAQTWYRHDILLRDQSDQWTSVVVSDTTLCSTFHDPCDSPPRMFLHHTNELYRLWCIHDGRKHRWFLGPVRLNEYVLHSIEVLEAQRSLHPKVKTFSDHPPHGARLWRKCRPYKYEIDSGWHSAIKQRREGTAC